SGSLGLDLATTVECTLVDNRPQRVPTGVRGPLKINNQCVGALLIGRSSSAMAGLNILVGLVDADYEGEIQIMVQTLYPPLHIPAGSRIAQLVPLPHLVRALGPPDIARQDKGFGSTGAMNLLTVDLCRQPSKPVTIIFAGQTLSLTALLDTGADVTVVA
ncbi:POK9 protein, partial [Ptilonorhynchus violaceus]|nr:POK9 protein [Ptilonorhynchus violaceus]